MHARTHARTHAHPRLTKETQRKVRAPPWFVGPVRGSEASTANICRVTKLGLTAELGHIPVRELSVSGGERGKKGASPGALNSCLLGQRKEKAQTPFPDEIPDARKA